MRERAPPGLIDNGLTRKGIQLGNRVVALFAADKEAAEGPRVADAEAGGVIAGAEGFAGGEGREVPAVAFARVVDLVTGGAEGGEEALKGGDDGARGGDGVALAGEVAARGADCSWRGGLEWRRWGLGKGG